MIKAILTHTEGKSLDVKRNPGSDRTCLITERLGAIVGTFKSVTNAGAATATIAEPKGSGNGAIILTDLILSANKVNNGTVTIRFNDDTYTETIYLGDASNNTINIAIAFQGHWQGWKGARLELITDTLGQDVTACVGYYKVREEDAMSYGEWNEIR